VIGVDSFWLTFSKNHLVYCSCALSQQKSTPQIPPVKREYDATNPK
jgi:hypothetical protein